MTIQQIERYTKDIIPRLESDLSKETSRSKRYELYHLYIQVLRMVAPFDFISFNKYLELDEDHTSPGKAFYHQRKKHMAEVFETFNDMEIYDKYDIILISLPPRVGKTTTGIRFLAWISGRYPEDTELATSYSDNITTSFYNGVIEIVQSKRYKEVFPDAPLVNQNAKREEIWLKVEKRYPTISFVPIGGSMTGRCEAGKYLYCDDLVSGFEEAISLTRMEKLWNLYTVNCKQRKLDGAKEIHVATVWSVHDPISRLTEKNKNNPRCKTINIPCFDDEGETNFDFNGGFSTEFYRTLEEDMDPLSFNALYKGEAVEREGLLYHDDELSYFYALPADPPDTIVAVCDSKNLGIDNVASPIGYLYGDSVYIVDVVFNPGLPEITRPLVANKWVEHHVVRADVEMNNGGNYFAEDLDELIQKAGGNTSIKIFFSGNNKRTKIITYADFVKKKFIFRAPGTYPKNGEYAKFMKSLFTWTQMGNNPHDDGPDSIAMLAQMVQELNGNAIKIIDRRSIGL